MCHWHRRLRRRCSAPQFCTFPNSTAALACGVGMPPRRVADYPTRWGAVTSRPLFLSFSAEEGCLKSTFKPKRNPFHVIVSLSSHVTPTRGRAENQKKKKKNSILGSPLLSVFEYSSSECLIVIVGRLPIIPFPRFTPSLEGIRNNAIHWGKHALVHVSVGHLKSPKETKIRTH